jgi:hypothetical protein
VSVAWGENKLNFKDVSSAAPIQSTGSLFSIFDSPKSWFRLAPPAVAPADMTKMIFFSLLCSAPHYFVLLFCSSLSLTRLSLTLSLSSICSALVASAPPRYFISLYSHILSLQSLISKAASFDFEDKLRMLCL